MSELVSNRWLSEAMDKYFRDEPDLVAAYDMDPYPSDMSGEGQWFTLYNGGEPFAILWYSPDTESVGIELGHNCFQLEMLTVENLRLRLHKSNGLSAYEAFQDIASRHDTSEEQDGDLSAVKQTMVQPIR